MATEQDQHQPRPSEMGQERETTRNPPAPEVIARGHEGDEVGVRATIQFAIWFTASMVVVCLFVWWMMVGMERVDARTDPPRSRLVQQEKQNLKPPEPWLQPSPPQGDQPRQASQDTRAFEEKERRMLESYRVIDAQAGIVQIPIVRAMNILAERGVPTAPHAAPGTAPRPATQPAQTPGGFR